MMMRNVTARRSHVVVRGVRMGLAGVMSVLGACAPRVMTPAKDRPSLMHQVPPVGATTVPIQVLRGGIVLVPAEVDGHHGVFLLDTGGPAMLVNTEYLHVTPAGALDTNAVRSTDTLVPARGVHHTWELDSLLVRIGTLTMPVTPRSASAAVHGIPIAVGAQIHFLSTLVGQPVLGILGLPVLAPYETIIDYTHRQLTLIPVDSTGQRLVTMPQYAPVTILPMFPDGEDWFVEARLGGLLDTLQLDTGNDRDELNGQTHRRIVSHLRQTGQWNVIDGTREPGVALDQLTLAGRSFAEVPFYVSQRQSCLGGEFFWRNVGVIGLNFRGRRLVFYH